MRNAMMVLWALMICLPLAAADKNEQTDRLVVIDGSLTEIVYALGADDAVVAVDTTSVYPKAATELPNVGYMRALSTEGILSMRPTQVIASTDAGPAPVFDQLKASGVAVHNLPVKPGIEGLYAKIDSLGELLKKKAEASQLKQDIEKELAPLKDIIAGKKTVNGQKPKALLFLGMQGNQLMVAGAHTKGQVIMDILNMENAAAGIRGYKPFSKEAVIEANPDIIIVTSHGGQPPAMLSKQFAYTPAAKNGRLLVTDSALLLGFGPRLPEALQQVAEVAYGNLNDGSTSPQ